MSQAVFAFPVETSYSPKDFIVSAANLRAWEWVNAWPHWPANGLVLHGPQGCGKTHLAHVWAGRSGARFLAAQHLRAGKESEGQWAGPIILDDIERCVDEEALFHLLNHTRLHRIPLLITSGASPAQLPFALADVRSRILALPAVVLNEPDDLLLEAVLVKALADRQLRLDPASIAYLLARMERSFVAAQQWAARIDAEALRQRKTITLPWIRRLYDDAASQQQELSVD